MVDVQSDFPAKDPLDHRACRSQGRLDCLGAVTDTVPHPPGTFGAGPADPSWSAAFDLVYWYNLRYSGDRRSAAKHYPALKLCEEPDGTPRLTALVLRPRTPP